MDWTELIDAFLSAKHLTLAPNTRRAYSYDLQACAHLLNDVPISEITVTHLRFLLDASLDLAPRAPTTLARRKAALHSCFNWAYQQNLLLADPTAKLEAIPIGERDPRPLTEKQVEAILAAIPRHDLRNRLLLTLLYETGMRVGVKLEIKWHCFLVIVRPQGPLLFRSDTYHKAFPRCLHHFRCHYLHLVYLQDPLDLCPQPL